MQLCEVVIAIESAQHGLRDDQFTDEIDQCVDLVDVDAYRAGFQLRSGKETLARSLQPQPALPASLGTSTEKAAVAVAKEQPPSERR